MKKLLYLFLAITVACSSGDDDSSDTSQCPDYETVFNNYEATLEDWQLDPNNIENCRAYYNSILDVIECAEPPLTSEEIEGWQAILNVLGCPN